MPEPVKYCFNESGDVIPHHLSPPDTLRKRSQKDAQRDLALMTPKLSPERQAIVGALESAGIPLDVARLHFLTGFSQSSLRNMLSKLVKSRQIKKAGRGLYRSKPKR